MLYVVGKWLVGCSTRASGVTSGQNTRQACGIISINGTQQDWSAQVCVAATCSQGPRPGNETHLDWICPNGPNGPFSERANRRPVKPLMAVSAPHPTFQLDLEPSLSKPANSKPPSVPETELNQTVSLVAKKPTSPPTSPLDPEDDLLWSDGEFESLMDQFP